MLRVSANRPFVSDEMRFDQRRESLVARSSVYLEQVPPLHEREGLGMARNSRVKVLPRTPRDDPLPGQEDRPRPATVTARRRRAARSGDVGAAHFRIEQTPPL